MENSNNSIKKEEPSDDMTIKIQTFENISPLSIPRSALVQDLKDKIFESFNVPVLKQRLIFQGKLLQNTEKLATYKIFDESVIHLVAKSVEETPLVTPLVTSNANVTGVNSASETSESRINIEDIFPTLVEFPMLRSNRRQRRRRTQNFDVSECFESMHQNINSVQNLLACKIKYDDSQVAQTKTIIPFDFSKSKYEIGQWVDVKDTIDQWLEAQVIQVRNNQVYVHYNGWGTRWDEWIDFASPRIATFKTYTMQSPSSSFLSPYPHVACDANVEPQPRSIDSFYYMEKSVGFMNDISRTVEYLSKLRKKNINRVNEERRQVRRDDFEETKDKELQSRNLNSNNVNANSNNTNTTNTNTNTIGNVINTNQVILNNNDYELLFYITQMVPVMDRCGRLLSDVSLQLSHLILSPNLYPQLLLGYNQNIEVSDTLSCTSGYSMYTNEGSTMSGLNHNLQYDQNIINNLQNNRGNIVNSNQMVNNYSNLNFQHSTQMQTNINTNISVGTVNTNFVNTNTVNNNIVNTNTVNNNSVNPNLNYNLNSSSNELPFINRLQTNTTPNLNPNTLQTTTLNNSNNFDCFPKINLQVPSMLSPSEVPMYNGYNAYEPNIDIYVHTLVASSNNQGNNSNNSNTQVSQTIPQNNQSSLLVNSNPLNATQNIANLINGTSRGIIGNNNNSNPLLLNQNNTRSVYSVGINTNNTTLTQGNSNPNIGRDNLTNINNNLDNLENIDNSNSTNENELINNLLIGTRNNQNILPLHNNPQVNTNAGNTSTNNSSSGQLTNLLENLMNMIQRNPRRGGSVTSETSSTSTRGVGASALQNNPFMPNRVRTNTSIGSNTPNLFPRPINQSRLNSNPNRFTQNTGTSLLTGLYKDSSAQTDMSLNLLSLQKEQNYFESDVISNKSDKNMSLKNKNTVSYKSVSEISEFDEIDRDEPNDFVIRTNKNRKAKSVSQHSKLNESLHSVNSHISNNIFEEKDEDEGSSNSNELNTASVKKNFSRSSLDK